jgi:hypothetical protein
MIQRFAGETVMVHCHRNCLLRFRIEAKRATHAAHGRR